MKTCHQIQRKELDSPESRHESIRKKAKTILWCSTDLQRIAGEIVSVTGGEKNLIVQGCYFCWIGKCGGDRAAYSGTVHVNKDKLVSVRQVTLEINSANTFTVNKCNCKGQCISAQCSCIKSGILCSNHCHPGRVCRNREKQLYLSDKKIEIAKNGWLTDDHMLLVTSILIREHPEVDGLQDKWAQHLYFNIFDCPHSSSGMDRKFPQFQVSENKNYENRRKFSTFTHFVDCIFHVVHTSTSFL